MKINNEEMDKKTIIEDLIKYLNFLIDEEIQSEEGSDFKKLKLMKKDLDNLKELYMDFLEDDILERFCEDKI